MNWLTKLIYVSSGPTRSTQGESEESWKFVRPVTVWTFWFVALFLVAVAVKWIGPYFERVTERELLWLILIAVLWRRS